MRRGLGTGRRVDLTLCDDRPVEVCRGRRPFGGSAHRSLPHVFDLCPCRKGQESVPIIEAGPRAFQPVSSVPGQPALLPDRFCSRLDGFFRPPTSCDVL
ncbi:hypothetical protein STAFG_2426 [Streptomyces afghaniensis 772]|uniref:Uncharacterized protein n=1 Tax=Streptomyces afghaniensis 772 TaxID=1283301 RepID=S4N1F4_9ACTN|nr:hypothetical protein STAFG_2426 [Streptomyces afghaniensis 772]